MFTVYVLESSRDGKFYIGYTTNLRRRLMEHRLGRGSALTRQRHDWTLIYCEMYLDQQDALGRERFLKSGSGRRYLTKQLRCHLQKRR